MSLCIFILHMNYIKGLNKAESWLMDKNVVNKSHELELAGFKELNNLQSDLEGRIQDE